MKEAEWLACKDQQKMLAFLAGTASERKLRLFAVACCRRAYHQLTDRGKDALEFCERLADEPALHDTLQPIRTDPYGPYSFSSSLHAGEAVMATAPRSMRNTVATVAHRILFHLAILAGETALKSKGDVSGE